MNTGTIYADGFTSSRQEPAGHGGHASPADRVPGLLRAPVRDPDSWSWACPRPATASGDVSIAYQCWERTRIL